MEFGLATSERQALACGVRTGRLGLCDAPCRIQRPYRTVRSSPRGVQLAFGLPQWSSDEVPPTFSEDFKAITVGVILMPIVIPWGCVWRHYFKQPGDGWR